jgi:hypothetical protein
MNYGLSYASGSFEWRFAVAAQIVFAILLLAMIPVMPESPRWQVMRNMSTEATETLLRMHGTLDVNDVEIQTELKLINEAIELENLSNSLGWMEIFSNKPETQNIRRVALGWVCALISLDTSGLTC